MRGYAARRSQGDKPLRRSSSANLEHLLSKLDNSAEQDFLCLQLLVWCALLGALTHGLEGMCGMLALHIPASKQCTRA